MGKEKKYKDIELCSEEVQEVMGQVPPAILRYGSGVLLCIIVLLLAGSALFSYPEKVTTDFTLTSQNPPAYLVAKGGGNMERLYVGNGQQVCRGDLLAVLSSTARTEDVLYLYERWKEWENSGARVEQAGYLRGTACLLFLFIGLGQLSAKHAGRACRRNRTVECDIIAADSLG